LPNESVNCVLKSGAETIFLLMKYFLSEIDAKNRKGYGGYIIGKYDAKFKKDSGNYDLVIIGTPIRAGMMAPKTNSKIFLIVS